jgi:hypothetical protein
MVYDPDRRSQKAMWTVSLSVGSTAMDRSPPRRSWPSVAPNTKVDPVATTRPANPSEGSVRSANAGATVAHWSSRRTTTSVVTWLVVTLRARHP